MTRNGRTALVALFTVALIMLTMAGSGGAVAQAQSSHTVVVGGLSVAQARWAGTDLRISMGESVSFMVPGNAGYMVYERADARGTKRLCVARYGASGMEFEIIIDLFALDSTAYTPLDALGLGILSAGKRAEVLDSRMIEVGTAVGLDLTFRGVYVDRQLPKNDARMVMLTDMTSALMFVLVERQPKPEAHREVLDQMFRTVVFSSGVANV